MGGGGRGMGSQGGYGASGGYNDYGGQGDRGGYSQGFSPRGPQGSGNYGSEVKVPLLFLFLF